MRHDIKTEKDAIELQEKAVASLEDKFEKYGMLDESTVHDTLLLNEEGVYTSWKHPSSSEVGIPSNKDIENIELPYYTDNEETMGFDREEESGKIYYFGSEKRKPSDDIYRPLPGEVPGFNFQMPHPDDFLKMWKDFEHYPLKNDVANALGVSVRTVTNYTSKYRDAGYEIPERDSLSRGRQAGEGGKSAKEKASVYDGSGRTGRTRRIGNFPGEFYRDVSRIKKSARKSWLKNLYPQVKQWIERFKHSEKLFIKIFLFGYQMDVGNLIYELWYNPYDNTYVIFDQFGQKQARSYYTMKDAVNGLLNFIATEEVSEQIKAAEDTGNEQAVDSAKKQAMNMRQESNEVEEKFEEAIISEQFNFIGFSDSIDPDILRESILNENQALTSMFNDIINNEMIDSYDKSRVEKHKMQRKLFQKFRPEGEGNVEFPPPSGRKKSLRFLLSINRKNKLEGTFIKGFTFKDGAIDLEIWYMRENPRSSNERTYFQVFNLSGLRSEGTAPTLRGAYQIVMRKLSV